MEKYLTKANGKRELFDQEKLINSLNRAKVPKQIQGKIVDRIFDKIGSHTTTAEIYHEVFNILGESNYPKGKYGLKRAVMDLGPSGFPFEAYFALLLEHRGYSTAVGVMVQGKCVMHEVDIDARKDDLHLFVECKFHNMTGVRSDIKVALYTYARYQDILTNGKHDSARHESWLATNTRCTQDAIAYAKCVGMNIVSWGYPERDNLQDFIEEKNLYPITCLQTIGERQKQVLLANNIVMISQLEEKNLSAIIGLDKENILNVLDEANKIILQ